MKILSNPILIQFCTRMVIVWMTFFFQTLKIERFPALAHIAMIMFVISHGQADFEKGLSINHSNKKRNDSLETRAACSWILILS